MIFACLFVCNAFISINGSCFFFSTKEKIVPAIILPSNASQRIDEERDSKNKIRPKMLNEKRIIPVKSIRFRSNVTSVGLGNTSSANVKPIKISGKLIRKIAGQLRSEEH